MIGSNERVMIANTDTGQRCMRLVTAAELGGGGPSNLQAVLTAGNDANGDQIVNLSTLTGHANSLVLEDGAGDSLNLSGNQAVITVGSDHVQLTIYESNAALITLSSGPSELQFNGDSGLQFQANHGELSFIAQDAVSIVSTAGALAIDASTSIVLTAGAAAGNAINLTAAQLTTDVTLQAWDITLANGLTMNGHTGFTGAVVGRNCVNGIVV